MFARGFLLAVFAFVISLDAWAWQDDDPISIGWENRRNLGLPVETEKDGLVAAVPLTLERKLTPAVLGVQSSLLATPFTQQILCNWYRNLTANTTRTR